MVNIDSVLHYSVIGKEKQHYTDSIYKYYYQLNLAEADLFKEEVKHFYELNSCCSCDVKIDEIEAERLS